MVLYIEFSVACLEVIIKVRLYHGMVYSPCCHSEPFCKYCLICTYCYPSWRPCFMHVIKQRIRDCAHNANTIGSHYNMANCNTWWRHQMETFSALLAICAGNSPVTGEFPAQRPVTRNFDVFFNLRLNKRLRKQSWGWWFEMPSRPLWRHCNDHIAYSVAFVKEENDDYVPKSQNGIAYFAFVDELLIYISKHYGIGVWASYYGPHCIPWYRQYFIKGTHTHINCYDIRSNWFRASHIRVN